MDNAAPAGSPEWYAASAEFWRQMAQFWRAQEQFWDRHAKIQWDVMWLWAAAVALLVASFVVRLVSG
jgi:hypothetical protein